MCLHVSITRVPRVGDCGLGRRVSSSISSPSEPGCGPDGTWRGVSRGRCPRVLWRRVFSGLTGLGPLPVLGGTEKQRLNSEIKQPCRDRRD